MSAQRSTFEAILAGDQEGTIIVRNDEKRMALIDCLEPEAAVHWLAVPYEAGYSTEDMLVTQGERFNELLRFAVDEAKSLVSNYPILGGGFTLKWHIGAFETVPHAKVHVLSTE